MQTLELPEEIQEPNKTDIHACLAEAAGSDRTGPAMINYSVRLPEGIKNEAKAICERNATDLSTYLRECTKALIRDYGIKQDDLSQ